MLREHGRDEFVRVFHWVRWSVLTVGLFASLEKVFDDVLCEFRVPLMVRELFWRFDGLHMSDLIELWGALNVVERVP